MNTTLLKTLIAGVSAGLMSSGCVILVLRARSLSSILQLFGTASLMIVVLTHFCEALHLFPQMQWGSEHSAGHYLDLCGAILGVTLFPLGYLWAAITLRSKEQILSVGGAVSSGARTLLMPDGPGYFEVHCVVVAAPDAPAG